MARGVPESGTYVPIFGTHGANRGERAVVRDVGGFNIHLETWGPLWRWAARARVENGELSNYEG